MFDSNLLAPLTFTESEIGPFLRDNACALCGGHLESRHASGRTWAAYCPKCGPICQHNHIRRGQAERNRQGPLAVQLEQAGEGNQKSIHQNLTELGF